MDIENLKFYEYTANFRCSTHVRRRIEPVYVYVCDDDDDRPVVRMAYDMQSKCDAFIFGVMHKDVSAMCMRRHNFRSIFPVSNRTVYCGWCVWCAVVGKTV